MEGITNGRIVHYVAYNRVHLGAMIIGCEGNTNAVDLVVFTALPNVAGNKNFGTQFHQNVAYSDTEEPGTWHWIKKA